MIGGCGDIVFCRRGGIALWTRVQSPSTMNWRLSERLVGANWFEDTELERVRSSAGGAPAPPGSELRRARASTSDVVGRFGFSRASRLPDRARWSAGCTGGGGGVLSSARAHGVAGRPPARHASDDSG
eukprot:1061753-Prymnesium_polylepis.1